MARKFRIPTARIRFVNRCIFCGKIIPQGDPICTECKRKARRNLQI